MIDRELCQQAIRAAEASVCERGSRIRALRDRAASVSHAEPPVLAMRKLKIDPEKSGPDPKSECVWTKYTIVVASHQILSART